MQLSNATSGYHYHLVEAASEERLDLIEEQLKKQDSCTASAMGAEYKTGRKRRMTIAEIQQEILRMKKEQDVCILAHAYQGQEILEVADYMGDSYGLSVQASKSKCSGVIMCGVRFMAETCKILSRIKSMVAKPCSRMPDGRTA